MKIPRPTSFTFGSYKIHPKSGRVTFKYEVRFKYGIRYTFKDTLYLKDVPEEAWSKVPNSTLEPTLEALSIMLGINYWCVFPTPNTKIKGFTLTKEQADFWETLYLHGLGEFFYEMQMRFENLIHFPYDTTKQKPEAQTLPKHARALLLNGAGKDSILSAEILKTSGKAFDFFSFSPTRAHKRIAQLVGAETVSVTRRRDPMLGFVMGAFMVSTSYPSVSTFTFIAVLLSQLLGYDEIVFSNERSADFGNFEYCGLPVNHQWCKSSMAEDMTNEYIRKYITPSITSLSLLRKYSEIEIVRRFVQHTKYLKHVTSCNNYFWLTSIEQALVRTNYWCKNCPKCVFLFACFGAFMSKKDVVEMFGDNLYTQEKLIPLFKRILGLEGFKPLDCVGEPEEMILAMHYTALTHEYDDTPAIKMFRAHFPENYDFETIAKTVLED